MKIDLSEIEIDLSRSAQKPKKVTKKRGRKKASSYTPKKKADPNSRLVKVVKILNQVLPKLRSEGIYQVKLSSVVAALSSLFPEVDRRALFSSVYTAAKGGRLEDFYYEKDKRVLTVKKKS